MSEDRDVGDISPTLLADQLDRSQVMDLGIRPLWTPVPRVAGPAFTVRCPPGDNLMLHAAIHRAPAGSVIVVDAGGDVDHALAGGNVCAVAQRRGVVAFVLDGVICDLEGIREAGFPVFARGVLPIPGAKTQARPLNVPVRCGGVLVEAGDVVVADEEGVVSVPRARREEVFSGARAKLAEEAAETLEEWERRHEQRISAILAEQGFDA